MMLRFLVCLFIVFALNSCKNEPAQVIDENASPFEQEYFADYDVPRIKWGYINKKSEVIIEAIYDDTRDFRSGIALANYGGRWGYIDTKGETIIPHQYVEASSFNDGAALVKSFDGSQAFINEKGVELFSV